MDNEYRDKLEALEEQYGVLASTSTLEKKQELPDGVPDGTTDNPTEAPNIAISGSN
jgi:hypothetical protein